VNITKFRALTGEKSVSVPYGGIPQSTSVLYLSSGEIFRPAAADADQIINKGANGGHWKIKINQ
jgi:hypothetical protein